jgi:hypothetical protein
MGTWHNVSKLEPCPICHKPDWCTLSNDGMMCVCRRVQSPHPAKSGMGWVHVLVERPKRGMPAHGFTDNYIRVELDQDKVSENTLVKVRLGGLNAAGDALTATIIE